MKKTIINLIAVLVIVAGTFGATRQWFPKVQDNTVTDTVRVDVPYEVEKIVEREVPVRVTEYKTDTIRVESVRVEKDTVFVDTNLNTFIYDTRFLTNYPQSPRFLGLQYANRKLELTYQSTDGEVQGKTWVAPQGYRVGLNNGRPNIETFKEGTEFNYSIEGGYIRFFSYGGPYLQLNTEFSILGIDVTGTINANQNPFGKVGVKYEF